MSFSDKTALFKQYLESLSDERFEQAIAEIDSLGIEGPSIDEYQKQTRIALASLNSAFADRCDDITYSSLFHKTIGPISMPQLRVEIELLIESSQTSECTPDSDDCTFASAA